jgi:hypothetical protein
MASAAEPLNATTRQWDLVTTPAVFWFSLRPFIIDWPFQIPLRITSAFLGVQTRIFKEIGTDLNFGFDLQHFTDTEHSPLHYSVDIVKSTHVLTSGIISPLLAQLSPSNPIFENNASERVLKPSIRQPFPRSSDRKSKGARWAQVSNKRLGGMARTSTRTWEKCGAAR